MERKEANFFSAQKRLWAGIFDYGGTSTRKEYWFAFLFHAILGVFAFFCLLLSVGLFLLQDWLDAYILLTIAHYILLIPAILIFIYLCLSIIPWIPLTVRRLRDAGKSGWWTILLLFVGIGHIILLFLCALGSTIGGVAFFAANNRAPSVYGPPDWYNSYNPQNNVPDPVYGPPYDPNDNINGDVYGPPDWFDPSYNEPQTEYGPPVWIEDDNDDYDPSNYDTVPMYGPPPFDEDEYVPQNNDNQNVYGPPSWFNDDDDDDFDPDVNINEDVYGPPEWFEGNDDTEGLNIDPLEEDDFNVDINMQPTVYGPPDWFE